MKLRWAWLVTSIWALDVLGEEWLPTDTQCCDDVYVSTFSEVSWLGQYLKKGYLETALGRTALKVQMDGHNDRLNDVQLNVQLSMPLDSGIF